MTKVNYEILLDGNYVVSASSYPSAVDKYETAVDAFAQSAGVVTLRETITTEVMSSHLETKPPKYGVWVIVQAMSELLKDWDEGDLAEMFNIDKDAATNLIAMAKQVRGDKV